MVNSGNHDGLILCRVTAICERAVTWVKSFPPAVLSTILCKSLAERFYELTHQADHKTVQRRILGYDPEQLKLDQSAAIREAERLVR